MGAVGDYAHSGVGNAVPNTGDQNEERGIHEAKPEDVGIEEGKIIAEHLPEHRRSHVAEAITDFFF